MDIKCEKLVATVAYRTPVRSPRTGVARPARLGPEIGVAASATCATRSVLALNARYRAQGRWQQPLESGQRRQRMLVGAPCGRLDACRSCWLIGDRQVRVDSCAAARSAHSASSITNAWSATPSQPMMNDAQRTRSNNPPPQDEAQAFTLGRIRFPRPVPASRVAARS